MYQSVSGTEKICVLPIITVIEQFWRSSRGNYRRHVNVAVLRQNIYICQLTRCFFKRRAFWNNVEKTGGHCTLVSKVQLSLYSPDQYASLVCYVSKASAFANHIKQLKRYGYSSPELKSKSPNLDACLDRNQVMTSAPRSHLDA